VEPPFFLVCIRFPKGLFDIAPDISDVIPHKISVRGRKEVSDSVQQPKSRIAVIAFSEDNGSFVQAKAPHIRPLLRLQLIEAVDEVSESTSVVWKV